MPSENARGAKHRASDMRAIVNTCTVSGRKFVRRSARCVALAERVSA